MKSDCCGARISNASVTFDWCEKCGQPTEPRKEEPREWHLEDWEQKEFEKPEEERKEWPTEEEIEAEAYKRYPGDPYNEKAEVFISALVWLRERMGE